jgi:RP/EB family microtubule-associated protein
MNTVPMNKLNWSASQDFEYVGNYKILQSCFTKLNIDRFIDVDRLISGKYMDNLEFMQWFKRYYELNCVDKGNYDCKAQRAKGKGGSVICGGQKPSAVPTIRKTLRQVVKPSIKATIKEASATVKEHSSNVKLSVEVVDKV